MKWLMDRLIPTRIEPTLDDHAQLAYTRLVRDAQFARYKRSLPYSRNYDPEFARLVLWNVSPFVRLR